MFKVGDSVQVIASGSSYCGMRGVVTEVRDRWGETVIVVRGGKDNREQWIGPPACIQKI